MFENKRKNYLKKVFGIMAFISLSTGAYSGEWLSINDPKYTITDTDKIILVDNSDSVPEYNAILIQGNSSVNGKNLKKLSINVEKDNTKYTSVNGIKMQPNEISHSEFIADTLSISITPKQSGENVISTGINLNDDVKFFAKDLNIDLVNASEKEFNVENISTGNMTIGTTGIVLDKLIRSKDNLTRFEANNVNIKVSNTKNSDNKWFEYALSGIDILKDEKEYGKDIFFRILGNLDIKVEDKSESQNPEVLSGIYVSAIDTEVELNNTNINIIGGKKSSFVSGIDIVYVDDTDFKTSGIINSIGALNIDTIKSPNGVGVSISGNGGELKADFEKSSTNLKTAGTAILFRGAKTYIDKEDDEEDKKLLREIVGKNYKISLKNAKISTTYNGKNQTQNNIERNLILVEEDVKNATLNLSGKETEVKAAETPDAYLIYVRKGGQLAVNLDNGALIEGKIDGGYATEENSNSGKVVLNIGNNSIWKLQNKSSKSNVSNIKLENGGKIDASNLAEEGYSLTMGNGNGSIISDTGIITMANSKYNDTLNIYGTYEGKNGAKLRLNTLWNNDETKSSSDKLIINGEAKGTTNIVAVSINGNEEIIDGDIKRVAQKVQNSPIVVEANTASEIAFIGKANTTGSGQAQLASKLEKGKRVFFWTLNALDENNNNSNNNNNTNNSTNPIDNTNSSSTNNNSNSGTNNISTLPKTNGTIIYNEVVPAYTSIKKINSALGFSILATLYERKGINKNTNNEVWFRTFGENIENTGKNRFETDTNLYGVQAGYEFDKSIDESGNQRNIGTYIAYAEAETKLYDKYRAENGRVSSDKYTGKVESKDLSVGLTATKYYTDNKYIDLVGQISSITNNYKFRTEPNVKQKARALTLSAELGKAYDLIENWNIEPQVQFIHQYMNLKDFSDGIRNVKYDNENIFKGRVGFRVSNNSKTSSLAFYSLVNIWYDFNGRTKVDIGKDKIEEKYAKTMAEIGLGAEYLFAKNISLYADFRYKKSLGSNPKSNLSHGTLGIKYSW